MLLTAVITVDAFILEMLILLHNRRWINPQQTVSLVLDRALG